MTKIALITGITGQDGSYLSELLLSLGYEVHGLVRRSSSSNMGRIAHICKQLHIHHGDLSDSNQISNIIHTIKPNEIYNLAAQSHVGMSFDMPEYTGDITALGVTRILEAVRKIQPSTKFYQASSSEMFGNVHPPQTELSPFSPRSPYACAKLYAYWMVRNYRRSYGMFAVNGILFNHESPRRGESFVTRKITSGIADILAGKATHISLGNLEAKRDWGFAPEYVEAMWLMMQQKSPDDYVIGTGETHTVQEFVDYACRYAGLDQSDVIISDPALFRPGEVNVLCANATKACDQLGWKSKVGFHDLCQIMVDADMRRSGLTPIGEGDKILKDTFPNRWWSID